MKTRIITTILLACLLSVNAQGQTAVTSMTETTDFIPGDDQRRDFNNQLCALVKIQVLDEITEVEGNIMGEVVNRGVEKWVYMAQGSRNMKIHLKNNLPIVVKFKDHQIDALKSNRVYVLVLSVPNQSKTDIEANTKGNNLQIRVTPNNATVVVWGDNQQKKTYRPNSDGTLVIFLPYGRYYYQASANGYKDEEGNVFVNDEGKWTDILLSPIMGSISISCPTEKAEFYIDNTIIMKDRNSTTWSGQVTPGRHTIKISRKGYIDQTQIVDVSPNQQTLTSFNALISEQDQQKAELEKKRAEEERIKAEQKAEQERIRAEQKAEQERMRAEEERIQAQQRAEKKKKREENMQKEAEERAKMPLQFGLRAGYNMASANFKEGTTSSASGFHIGLNMDVKLLTDFYLSTGLLYSAKGYSYEGKKAKEKGNPSYIDIPVMASVRIPMGLSAQLQLSAGPYVALCIGGKATDELYNMYDESFSSAYSGFDYGLQVAAGVIINHHFYIGAGYQFGMESNYPNKNLFVGIGYNF